MGGILTMYCAKCNKRMKSAINCYEGNTAIITAYCEICKISVTFTYNGPAFYQIYNDKGEKLGDGYGISPYCI
jgi:hypothetical protein